MRASQAPAWWQDVHRALESAFADYTGVLETLERVLVKEASGAYAELQEGTRRFAFLVGELDRVGEHLHRALKLAQARTDDALASGRKVPAPEVYRDRMRVYERRAAVVGNLLQNRMTAVTQELNRRTKRRPNRRIFQDIAPSQIDLRL